jgi:hypothetical protein
VPIPFEWEALKALPEGTDGQRVISAARQDLVRTAQVLAERFDGALSLSSDVQSSFEQPDQPRVIVLVGDKLRCEFTVAALRNALKKRVGPVDLIASAVVRMRLVEAGELPPVVLDGFVRLERVGRANGPSKDQMRRHRQVARLPKFAREIEEAIEAGHDVMIDGKPGSGRTALAAVVAQELNGRGYSQIWLDLTDPGDGPESVVAELLTLRRCQPKHLVVVDGLQANIPVANHLLPFIARLRHSFGLNIRILATTETWRADELTGGEQRFVAQRINVSAQRVIGQMLDDESISGEDRKRLEALAGDDVHIALDAIEFFQRQKRVPDEEELQRNFTGDTAVPKERQALYYLSCLGALSLVMSEVQAFDTFDEPLMKSLLKRNLVHLADGAYTIAPRRRAVLVMNYARRHWPEIEKMDPPENVVLTHLQSSDRLIQATLGRIRHLVPPDQLSSDSDYLLSAWETSERLARWLEEQTNADPDWADNLGSAVFAGMALSRQGRPDQWRMIAERVRQRFHYDDPAMPWPEPDPERGATTDMNDFKQITKEMIEEDERYGKEGHPSGMSAEDFDPELAYRTWALGLLLCFEATAPLAHRDDKRIKILLTMAKRAVEPDGNFYPVRVPWVTARVLMGICHAENAPQENEVVTQACTWLIGLTSGKEPGEVVGRWLPGTGNWNTIEATTAMCVIALVSARQRYRAGTVIDAALQFLESREAQWSGAGQEIDLAQVLEAFAFCTESGLLAERTQTLVREKLKDLLRLTWAELRKPAPMEDRPEERLRLPFLAAQLTEFVWRTLQSRFKQLLSDVMGNPGEPPAPSSGRPEGPRPRPGPPDAAAPPRPAGGLTTGQLRVWVAWANQLRDTLNGLIADRGGPGKSGIPLVRERLEENRRQQREYNELLLKLDEHASRETLEALDALGHAICGEDWPDLPYPDNYPDPAPS